MLPHVVRVLTYNVLEGARGRLDLVAAVLERLRPDAAALVEATEEATDELARRLGLHAVFGRTDSVFDAHVAWLSRRPVVASANHRLPELAKTLLEVEVEGVRLFATHLTSRHEEPDHPRPREVAAILAHLARVDVRHLLVGDFNALVAGDEPGPPPPGIVPRGDALPDAPRDVLNPFARAGYVDCYRALHDDPGYTYPADAPWLRLDYAFASAALAPRVESCEVVRDELTARASDHLPLVVELRPADVPAVEAPPSPARRSP
jgi:endonuclease/exonuclease/phosphatase family metal-dependent hydrolase